MKKKIIHGRNKEFFLFLLPSLTGVLIFVLIPFLDSIRRSFCSMGSGKFVGIKNYKVITDNDAFTLAVKNTTAFTLCCIPLLITISFFVAYAMNKLRHIRVIKSMLLFPLAVPTAVLVLVWKMLFNDAGYINNILVNSGHESVRFLHSDPVFWVLVASYVWKNAGYTILLWLTGLAGISSSVEEAARVDGANEWQLLTRIILPDLKPTLYTITIVSFLNSFKVFREAYLVAGAYPDDHIYLLQHVFNNWFVNMDLDKMAAAAAMVFIVIFIAIVLLQRAWDKEKR
ncbi:MAG: sugar ABC transporter permease [Oscillospiraceae bacterium]|nr:sugar ABC transporter permease [Oscillospiraceae bacterium]